jgi:glutamate synthase (NADPH/NADH) large chain
VKYFPTSTDSAQGLYHPTHEHDACGVGFIAHIKGQANHSIIEQGLKILQNLDHRGAVGTDTLMGDGAGILIQIPHKLYQEEMYQQNIALPPVGEYGVGMVFLPKEHAARQACIEELERVVKMEGQQVIGWRNVPVDSALPMSPTVLASAPIIRQIFIGRGRDIMTTDAFERKLYIIRVRADHAIRGLALHHAKEYFVPSLSARTVIYKGLLLAHQVGAYYADLVDQRTISAFAIVHQRFSTNTFPAWQLAHPYRMIAHNGEINTIKGNVNWINARTESIASPVLGKDLQKLWPLIYPGQSDTASFDNCVELLTMSGYQLPHAMMMMIPEAWEHHALMDDKRRAFYEYHAAMMEPWDGPAAMIFTDGKQIGATLDRNGLRPARFYITRDDLVIMASEAGVLRLEQNQIAYKGRLRPGKMFLLDMELGHIIDDKTLKNIITNIKPYKAWVETVRIKLDEVKPEQSNHQLAHLQRNLLDEPDHSGLQNDPGDYAHQTFSETFAYSFGYSSDELSAFKQFAQGQTDEISYAQRNNLAILSEEHRLLFDYFNPLVAQATNPPIDAQYENIVMSLVSFIGPKPDLLDINNINPPMRLEVAQPILDFAGMEKIHNIARYTRGKFCSYRLNLCYPVLWGKEGIEARIASLCAEAVDAVQSNYNILVLSDRDVDSEHVAIPILLATSAIHQHLVSAGLRTSTGLVVETGAARTAHHFALLAGYGAEAIHPYLALQILVENARQDSYADKTHTDHQAISLANHSANHVIQRFIEYITNRLQQILAQIGISTYMSYTGSQMFEAIGISNKVIHKYFKGTLSHIDGLDIFDIAAEILALHQTAFTQQKPTVPAIELPNSRCLALRDLLQLKQRGLNRPLPLTEIEAAETIAQRFMVSHEISMRQSIVPALRTQIIQADRTGLTLNQLAQTDCIEIKIADYPSSQNISISPHHDIYSIEDLAQLIYDLRNVNPKAEIAAKLISQSGVGTVAAGIAKAKADLIIISGHDTKHTQSQLDKRDNPIASPWEIGLAETQQTLVINNLRSRVRLQVEGHFDNGRDIVIAALLGAELFSFNLLPNTLLSNTNGNPQIKNYFLLIAEEVRGWLSQLGMRCLDDLIGRADLLEMHQNIFFEKAQAIDLSRLLYQPVLATQTAYRKIAPPDHALDEVLDQQFLAQVHALLEQPELTEPIQIKQTINNSHRAIGALLSGEITRQFSHQQLPDDSIHLHLTGTAGQSFGAFLAQGITLDLAGDANDYVGKGLSGGRIIVRAPQDFYADTQHNIIVGNTVLYGANCGSAFFNGVAGERFAACNAGAIAITEGVGDHGCECMTGGTILILGPTGRNFAAGMSGGVAYVYDEEGLFSLCCNTSTVQIVPVKTTSQEINSQTENLPINHPPSDEAILKSLIEQHYRYTQSSCADKLLKDWPQSLKKFVKVVPKVS